MEMLLGWKSSIFHSLAFDQEHPQQFVFPEALIFKTFMLLLLSLVLQLKIKNSNDFSLLSLFVFQVFPSCLLALIVFILDSADAPVPPAHRKVQASNSTHEYKSLRSAQKKRSFHFQIHF